MTDAWDIDNPLWLGNFYPPPPESHVSRARLQRLARAISRACECLGAECDHRRYERLRWDECVMDVDESIRFALGISREDATLRDILREALSQVDGRDLKEPLSVSGEALYAAGDGMHYERAAEVIERRLPELPPPPVPRTKKGGRAAPPVATRAKAAAAARVRVKRR